MSHLTSWKHSVTVIAKISVQCSELNFFSCNVISFLFVWSLALSQFTVIIVKNTNQKTADQILNLGRSLQTWPAQSRRQPMLCLQSLAPVDVNEKNHQGMSWELLKRGQLAAAWHQMTWQWLWTCQDPSAEQELMVCFALSSGIIKL